jgi:4-hydroxy-tetrahydrodipicolinate synthase
MPGAEVPWAIVALWNALERKDLVTAKAIHTPLAKLISFQTTLDAYVAVEKYLLVKQGIFSNTNQRGPVGFKLDQETKGKIDLAFNELVSAVGEIPN